MRAARRRTVLSAGAWCAPVTGFRAVGAGLVLAGHVLLAARAFPVRGIVHVGSVVVPCFFVITAASLHRPFLVAQLRGEAAPSTGGFWWNRFLRIYPLYALALTTYLVLIPTVRPASGAVVDYLLLYGLLQVYVPHLATHSGIPAAWFLCDEVGFYLALPLLAATAGRVARGRARRPLPTARTTLRAHAALGLGLIVLGVTARTGLILAGRRAVTAWPIGNLDFYGLGILLAVGGLRERAGLGLPAWVGRLRLRPDVAAWGVAIGLVLMSAAVRDAAAASSGPEDLLRYAVYWLIAGPLLVVMYLGPQSNRINRALASRRLIGLGRISLSVYLWQQLVLAGLDRRLGGLAVLAHRAPWVVVPALIAVTGGLTVAWSALTSRVTDLPYRRWAGRRRPTVTGAAALALPLLLLAAGLTIRTAAVAGHGPAQPPHLQMTSAGRTWITVRDGTLLAAQVHLPGPISGGPYPTVVEYSGYQAGGPGVTEARPASAIARRLGYATVSVSVRGSGCSGGTFELLGPTQAADGHDVIEAVASQPWVLGHRVGAIGFSYGGLGALEIAGSAPPSLAGVVALGVWGEAAALFQPGGLVNDGFARGWLASLDADARPPGPGWLQRQLAAGDLVCRRNQADHRSPGDLVHRFLGQPPRRRQLRAASPAAWAATTRVPVLVSATAHDAVVGADLPRHLRRYRHGTAHLVLTNGGHADNLAPQIVARVREFLDATVTRTGTAALHRPPVEVLLESGNAEPPGAAAAPVQLAAASWPPPATRPPTVIRLTPRRSLHLEPARAGAHYEIEGRDLHSAEPARWPPPTPGTAVAWLGEPITEPITEPMVLLGEARVDLWLRSTSAPAQLQLQLTSVGADGSETLVQSAWATIDSPPGRWARLHAAIGPLVQIVRPGTRLRLIMGTPGDEQVQWAFRPSPGGPATVELGRAGARPSTLRLPLMPLGRVRLPERPPACGVLRGQPCRPMAELPVSGGRG